MNKLEKGEAPLFKWFKFGLASIIGLLLLIGIIIGIALTVIFNLYVDKQQKQISSSPRFADDEYVFTEDKSSQIESDSYVQKGILKKENYDLLTYGMSYKEAVKVIGSKGRLETETKNPGYHSLSYRFEENSSGGIDISLNFLNGKLNSKSFYSGTRDKSEATITADDFDKIKPDMTYEEVVEVVGGPGLLISDYGFPNDEYHLQTYKFDGNSGYSYADFVFEEGKMKSKSQYNLK